MALTVEVGLLVVTAIAFLVEFTRTFLDNYFLSPKESSTEKSLLSEAARLKAEAKMYESPDTLLEFAKIGREAAKLEARADSLREEREGRKKTKLGERAALVTRMLLPLPVVFVWLFWTYFVSDMEPVAFLPNPSWLWPMAHVLALPNQPPNGSISSIGWMFLSRRVFSRFFTVLWK